MQRMGAAAGRAKTGLVLLHGRGGNPADILGLLEHAALPDVAALAPEAPGNSWWPTSFLAPAAHIEPFVAAGLSAVRASVAALVGEGLPRNLIWLGGFSQGACLALEAFARDDEGLAGVIALSGGLVGSADAPGAGDPALYGHQPKHFDYPGHRKGAKVWISVHAQDPHIPLRRATDSATALRAMGADVETLVYPGAGHAVMAQDIAAMRRLLNS